MYLFPKLPGVWIFGNSPDSECGAGIYRVEPSNDRKSITIIVVETNKILWQDKKVTSFQKANGSDYGNFAELQTAYQGFFQSASFTDLYPSGKPTKLTLSFNRPANVLDYAANDAIGPVTANAAALPFEGDAAFINGGGGTANLIKMEVPAKFAGQIITCYLYNELPSSLVGDNLPFVLDTANRLKRVAKVSVTIDAIENSSTIAWGQQEILIPYQCIPGSKLLYAAFKVGGAVVAPENAGLFTIALMTTIQA
jgi:hypothetical protein